MITSWKQQQRRNLKCADHNLVNSQSYNCTKILRMPCLLFEFTRKTIVFEIFQIFEFFWLRCCAICVFQRRLIAWLAVCWLIKCNCGAMNKYSICECVCVHFGLESTAQSEYIYIHIYKCWKIRCIFVVAVKCLISHLSVAIFDEEFYFVCLWIDEYAHILTQFITYT